MKTMHIQNTMPFNEQRLEDAHIAVYKNYNMEKQNYYQNLMSNSSGNSYDIFRMARSRMKTKNCIPNYINGIKYYGAERFTAIAEGL